MGFQCGSLTLVAVAAIGVGFASRLHRQHPVVPNRFADRNFHFAGINLFQRFGAFDFVLLAVGDGDVALHYWFIIVPSAGVRIVVGVAAAPGIVVLLLPEAVIGGQAVGVMELHMPLIGTAAPRVVTGTGIPLRGTLFLSAMATCLILGHLLGARVHLLGAGRIAVLAGLSRLAALAGLFTPG